MRTARRASMAALALLLSGCAVGAPNSAARFSWSSSSSGVTYSGRYQPLTGGPATSLPVQVDPEPAPSSTAAPKPSLRFTMSFAGDVHFMQRTAARLAANPATVFAQAQPGLAKADLTMVNLETAITNRGTAQNKEYHFRTDPSALAALRDAGIDVATEANNHAADYGNVGLVDTLAAIKSSGFPVIGIGADATRAFAPYTTTINGQKIAIFAADRVEDETTLRLFSAGTDKPGVANAYDLLLLQGVKQAARDGYFVVVYLHWGTEDVSCTNGDQRSFAAQLSAAGAKAIIGAHPHVLQGAGWRPDGTFVAYSMGDYLWWTADSAAEYDTGLLTITVDHGKVVADTFTPARIDERGVPVPATGSEAARITGLWNQARQCSDVSATPPAGWASAAG